MLSESGFSILAADIGRWAGFSEPVKIPFALLSRVRSVRPIEKLNLTKHKLMLDHCLLTSSSPLVMEDEGRRRIKQVFLSDVGGRAVEETRLAICCCRCRIVFK
jgi:hypothetical protein